MWNGVHSLPSDVSCLWDNFPTVCRDRPEHLWPREDPQLLTAIPCKERKSGMESLVLVGFMACVRYRNPIDHDL